MINYYEELSGEEQQRVKESIQLLYRQTFLLERKYDRKTKRYQINREYHQCSKHLEFIQAYFALMDIEVVENSQMGVIYLRRTADGRENAKAGDSLSAGAEADL